MLRECKLMDCSVRIWTVTVLDVLHSSVTEAPHNSKNMFVPIFQYVKHTAKRQNFEHVRKIYYLQEITYYKIFSKLIILINSVTSEQESGLVISGSKQTRTKRPNTRFVISGSKQTDSKWSNTGLIGEVRFNGPVSLYRTPDQRQ